MYYLTIFLTLFIVGTCNCSHLEKEEDDYLDVIVDTVDFIYDVIQGIYCKLFTDSVKHWQNHGWSLYLQ